MLRPSLNISRRPFYLASGLLCFVLVSICLVSCGSVTVQSSPRATATSVLPVPAPTSLLVRGTLTVGSYTNYPPQEYVDKTSTVVGFDIDLITALARHMGLNTKIVQLDFTSLLPSLHQKDVDVVISALPITSDLQKKVDFVPYFRGGESLLVENGNPHHIKTTDDLCGLSVGVRTGTLEENDLRVASDNCKQNGYKPITTIALPDQNDVIHLLMSGHVVATYQDAPVSDYYILQAPSLFKIGGPVTNENVEGIAVRKGDAALLKAIQASFQVLRKDGTYHYLIMKWGLTTGELTGGTNG